MICVEQDELADYTVDPPVRGNCLAACVASIFERPLRDLYGIYDERGIDIWLRGAHPALICNRRHHFGPAPSDDYAPVPLGSEVPPSALPGAVLWIASVQSPRTDHLHCVVMRGSELAWDPHPRREMGVGDQHVMTWFELVRPERLR